MRNLSLLVILGLIYSVTAQVLGIDFGTEFWKAAIISPGKNLVIVENSRSERKTLNSIAFQDGVRYFEDDSQMKRLKKPDLSYFYLNKLIRSLDTKQPVKGQQFNGETYVFQQADQQMSLQQVVAMILKNIKNLASIQAGTEIKDVVLSVPSNWGFHAKMSLVNAAYLADLSVLGLINENSAAAIQFAISRNDTDPINIILFNYGSHNLQISVFKAFGFYDQQKNKTIESIETLSHTTVEDVGGLKVDQKIADYLAAQFMKKHKVDPTKNKKSYTKLLVKASDVKQTLSANKDTQVYIEALIDGIDLNLPISREVIQQCTHFNDFGKYIEEAITKAGITKKDVNQIQIIGGASRIPKVSAIIKQYFNDAPDVLIGSHMNGDESVAFGSALRAANLSLTFRVKQLHFYDPMNLDTKVIISSTDKGALFEQTLFHFSDHHGAKRTISLNHNDQDVKITVYVGDQIVKQFVTKGLGDWKQKHEKDNVTGSPNLVIEFMMSSIHIAEIRDIYLNVTLNVTSVREKVEYVEEQVEVQVKKEQETTQQQKKAQEEKQEKQGQQGKQQAAEGQQQQKTDEAEGEKKDGQKEPEKKKKQKKTKTIKKQVQEHETKLKKHVPTFEQTFSKFKKYSKDQIEEKRKLLHQFESHEKGIKEKAKIRNDFESALYNLKNNFEEKYLKTFSTEEELSNLIDTVKVELEWLQENAWTASKQQFEKHYRILSKAYDPIYNRTAQYQGREKAYNQSMGYLGMVYQKTEELLKTHSWINAKVMNLLTKINETAEWINNKIKDQIDRPLNQNPIIYNHEMIQKAEELRNQYYILKMTPRPKYDVDQILKEFTRKMQEQKKRNETLQQEEKEKQQSTQQQQTTQNTQQPEAKQEIPQEQGNQRNQDL